MVIYENYGQNPLGVDLTRAYSDIEMKIERDGVYYDEAIDPTALGRTYTETNIPIDDDDEDYAEAGRILLGVAE